MEPGQDAVSCDTCTSVSLLPPDSSRVFGKCVCVGGGDPADSQLLNEDTYDGSRQDLHFEVTATAIRLLKRVS